MNLIKEDLLLTKNALFYKREGEINIEKSIEEIIDEASKNRNNKEFILNEINKVSEVNNLSYTYSVRVFQINRPVYFTKHKEVLDLVYAYILILKIDDYIIVFSKNTSSISKELEKHFKLIKNTDFFNILKDDCEYQKLTLRNMTISNKDIRVRSYEAQNLDGLLSLHSAGRSIPTHVKVKEKNRKLSLSGTGRIVENSDRIDIDNLALWSKYQIELLNNINEKEDSFINNFARSVELKEILEANTPTAVLLEYNDINDYIESIGSPIFKKLKSRKFRKGAKYSKICDKRKKLIFDEMEKIHELDENNTCQNGISKLKLNKKGFSISSPDLKKFYISENGAYISLQSIINKQGFFSITFTDPSYMYFMRSCYQINSYTSEINNILDSIELFPEMGNITSEKGEITSESQRFLSSSLFDLIEQIHQNDKYIFCDDLGDEWADHIAINTEENCISFIHSKHKNVSNSASNLHDVIGQAIKNLGNMHFSKEKFLKKRQALDSFYSNSQIDRVRSGSLEELDNDLDELLRQHSLHRKCIIACSFLSKNNMESEFNKLLSKQKVRGNIVHLVWILSSFIHAAKELGIIPIIYCQP